MTRHARRDQTRVANEFIMIGAGALKTTGGNPHEP